MARVKVTNTFRRKIFTYIFIVIAAVAIGFLVYFVLQESLSSDAYDLGEMKDFGDFEDIILKDYKSYSDLMDEYGLTKKLTKNDFDKHAYLASFQDYDKCSEYKYKKIESVEVKKAIYVTYLVYNKCGMCKPHLVLYLVELPKDIDTDVIVYDYNYYSEKQCGNI